MKKIMLAISTLLILGCFSSCISEQSGYSNTASEILIITSALQYQTDDAGTSSEESSSEQQNSSVLRETSSKEEGSFEPAESSSLESSEPENSETSTNTVTVPEQAETGDNLVWVPVNGGTKYHSKSTCSKMKEPIQVTLDTAVKNGYTACKRCH